MTQKEQIQRFDNLVEKLRQTLSSKGKDYASEDVLSNFKESAERIGQKPYEQCLSMISQKVSRLSNLFKQDRKPNNESVQDSILDLIGYSFLLDAIIEEQGENNTPSERLYRAGAKGLCNITREEINPLEEISKILGEQVFDAARQDFPEGHYHWLKKAEEEVAKIQIETGEQQYQNFIKQAIFGEPFSYYIQTEQDNKSKPLPLRKSPPEGAKVREQEREWIKSLTAEDFLFYFNAPYADTPKKKQNLAESVQRASEILEEGKEKRAKVIEEFLDSLPEDVLPKLLEKQYIRIHGRKYGHLQHYQRQIKEAVKNRLVMESRGLRSTKEFFDRVDLERTQAELMQRILLLSLVNKLTRSEKDKQELIKCFDELISITEKLGEDTTELKQERSKLS
jgi:hypothetical protein